MELKLSQRNHPPLPGLCKEALNKCDEVWAAVAYVMDTKTLIQPCYDKKIPLKLWARHDYSLPVKPEILQQFLNWQSPNYTCKLVQGIFHPKIIWWKGYGIYFGSANLTDAAWFKNFEAGVFLSEFDIEEQNVRSEIEDYFELIDGHSHALTQELVKKIADYERNNEFKALQNSRWNAEKIELLPKLDSLSASDRERKKGNRQKNEFSREWNETLEHLRVIARIVSTDEFRPGWVQANTPTGVQADQFLHAYYYQHVRSGSHALHRQKHEENHANPEAARNTALRWWKNTFIPDPNDAHNEQTMMNEWAPYLQKVFQPNRILNMTEAEFGAAMIKIHAFRTYAGHNAKNQDLGLPRNETFTADTRREILAKKLYASRSVNGQTTLELLNDLLYGGSTETIPDRLYEAAWNPEKKIPHLGISCLGEIVGWALPDVMPPRNGRTSKALYALGYDVKLYSE